MGGSVSSGRDNDDLINNLCDSSHIKTEKVEKLFRAVDRGHYYLPTHREVAYRDLAWREGNIHISAPCIYSEVMEALELERGNAFLNIGSGTGYLSTMVGLQIGPYGINHNIEIHADVIDYAKARLNEFIKKSSKFDHFDFSTPKFIHGNFLNIIVDKDTCLYDRIYVGCGVGNDHVEFIKSLLKVNGVLVMPLEDYLVQIKRKSETEFEKKTVMSVSFATFINENLALNTILLPKSKPLSLQELCRYKIRELIRKSIEIDYPNYYKLKQRPKKVHDEEEDERESSRSARRIFLTRNTLTEAQLRMLIHGRLFDRNYFRDDEDDNDDDDDDDEDEVEEQVGVAADNTDRNVESSTIQDETTNEQQNEESKATSSTIPIPQRDSAANVSICESGVFSQSDDHSSSLDLANSLAKNIAVPSTSQNVNIKQPSKSSSDTTTHTKTDYESIGSQDSCFLSDNSSSTSASSSFNTLFHKNITVSNFEEPTETNDDSKKQSTINTIVPVVPSRQEEEEEKKSEIKAEPEEQHQVEDLYVNHLRNRILKLDIPAALKMFLLYNREI